MMESSSFCTVPHPWWVRTVRPDTLTLLRPSEPAVEVRCQPAIPSPVPQGFLVSLTGEDLSASVRLFPVPDSPWLLAVREGWAVELCSEFMEELVNHIAHDLRNLTFTVSLQAEIAARQAGEAKQHLDVILAQLGKVQAYLERLLLYGRKPRLAPVPLNVELFIRETLREAHHASPPDQAPPSFRLEVQGEAGVARWDPHLLTVARFEAILVVLTLACVGTAVSYTHL
ncbi:MAG: hypothetical protein N2447_09250, partial [Thermoanaerobaculum sp.]|nr:hypothetical protein [Thermoanaerobaculum sp.]